MQTVRDQDDHRLVVAEFRNSRAVSEPSSAAASAATSAARLTDLEAKPWRDTGPWRQQRRPPPATILQRSVPEGRPRSTARGLPKSRRLLHCPEQTAANSAGSFFPQKRYQFFRPSCRGPPCAACDTAVCAGRTRRHAAEPATAAGHQTNGSKPVSNCIPDHMIGTVRLDAAACPEAGMDDQEDRAWPFPSLRRPDTRDRCCGISSRTKHPAGWC